MTSKNGFCKIKYTHSMKSLRRILFIVVVLVLWSMLIMGCEASVELQDEPVEKQAESVTLPEPAIQVTTGTTSVMVSPTAELTPEPSPYPIEDLKVSETIEMTSTVKVDYPESHYITGIGGHSQYYYLSCESSAAVDWAWFFGVNIYESTFQADMPRSDNPDLGYVGDFTTRKWGQIPPYSYGVHAGPIAEALRAYDLPAVAVKGYTLDKVKQKLAEDKPIIAWIIGNLEYSEPVEYVDKAGNTVIVAPYEHVVILTGYNAESIRYMNNGKFFDAPTEVFLTSWAVLGNMVVIHE